MIRQVRCRAIASGLMLSLSFCAMLLNIPPTFARGKAPALAHAPRMHAKEGRSARAASEPTFTESREFAVLSSGAAPWQGRGLDLAREALPGSHLASVLGPGWKVEHMGRTPGAFALSGPAVAVPGGASPEALSGIVASLPDLFGTSAGQLRATSARTSILPVTYQLQQMLDGAPLRGAIVKGHFDELGRLMSIVSTVQPAVRPLNARVISQADAEAIATRALMETVPPARPIGVARTEPWLAQGPGGPSHVWIVRQATSPPRGGFVTTLDAQTGAILDRWDAAQSGLRVGRGLVCPSDATSPDEARLVRLRHLLGRARNATGLLSGLHVQVLDAKGLAVSSPDLRFEYEPWNAPDAFDQVSAYYHFERAHRYWSRNLKVKGVTWFDDGAAVPVEVNAQDMCGAFYMPDLYGDGVPGFVFSDQDSCGSLHPDYARDADVIYHEFSHGILDWSGIDVASAPWNSYQRAISEADADFHAASMTDDPIIGERVGVIRNVHNAKVYPADVPCDEYGFMEPHCTGQIWSGFLWDLRSVMGPSAERLELASLMYLIDNWPAGHVGGAYDFWDGTLALLRADRDLNEGRNVGLIYGAAASRGFFGPDPYSSDQVSVIYQVLKRQSRFRSLGWVHSPGKRVPFYFTAPAGSDVSADVRSTTPLTLVLSRLHGSGGTPIATSPLPPVAGTSSTLPSAREATLKSVLPGPALYVLEIVPMDSTEGTFEVTITIH